VQLVSAVLMESAPNLPGTGAVCQQGSKNKQQLPFAAEQLSAAEPHLVALQRLYQQETELSVQPLRHPRMMQLLLSGAPCLRSAFSNRRPCLWMWRSDGCGLPCAVAGLLSVYSYIIYLAPTASSSAGWCHVVPCQQHTASVGVVRQCAM
jgi:hypothetical protein